MVSGKSANQVWKELRKSGQTTLDFKSWLKREKEKGFLNVDGTSEIPVNKNLNTSIQDTLQQMHVASGYKTSATDEYVMGINKNALIWTGVVAGIVIVAIVIYKQVKQ